MAPTCLALALAGCASPGGSSRTLSATRQTPAATSTTSGGASSVAAGAGWSSFRDPRYGFVTQYPNDSKFQSPSPQDPTSDDSWLITDSRDATSNATLEVTATTQANASICAQYTSGKPVTVAGDITGYEQDNLTSATLPPGGAIQPQVAVLFLHGGLFYIITLTAPPPASTFMRRWSGVWNHVLDTFQSGQGPAGATPCG